MCLLVLYEGAGSNPAETTLLFFFACGRPDDVAATHAVPTHRFSSQNSPRSRRYVGFRARRCGCVFFCRNFLAQVRISRQKRCQNSSSAYVEGKGGAGRAAHPGGAPASNPCPRRLSRATPRPPSRAVVSSRPLEVARGVVVPASSSPAPAMDTTTSTPIGNEQRRRSGSRLAAAHRSPR